MHLGVLLSSVALASLVAASNNVRDVDPCAQIAKAASDAQGKTTVSVPQDLAYQCLTSMPFESDRATTFLTQIRKILEFHSTVDILKHPPSDYLMPSTDILGGVDSILEKVHRNAYTSHFEMDLDLARLLDSAHDTHLSFQLCSQSIFTLAIDVPIVSISTDGISLPEVYTLDDAKLQQHGSMNVSPIKSVNGTDVVKFLESVASSQNLQDPDAQYNRIFPGLVRKVSGTPTSPDGIWAQNKRWLAGSELVLKFSNGTSKTITKTAVPAEYLFNYQNGTQLYQVECLPRTLPSAVTKVAEQASEVSGLPGTPWSTSANSIAGYYSNLTGLEDTAVIFLPTFSSTPSDVAQQIIDFLKNASASKKKNVLIDVTSNPGGFMVSGLDISRIFFPESVPYTATRYRAHSAAKYMTKAYSREINPDADNIFAFRQMVTPDQKAGFNSWEDLYGPHDILGSSSSTLVANFNYTATSTKAWPINGYGPVPLNPPKAPFEAENIAIITDGDCVSTCAFFVKLMKRQGVRTIAFGGRPREAPMQGVGGVKGGQSLGVNYINYYIQHAHALIGNSTTSSTPLMTQAKWKEFNDSTPSIEKSYSWSGNLNLRNEYDPEDSDTPLQFVYEAAECRLFYTLENYSQQETVWQAAAKAMFGGGGCVKGSTNGKGSLKAS